MKEKYKEELDRIINLHLEEFVENIKKLSVKYKVNTNKNECYEIISKCYIKINDRIENDKLNINTSMKHYFGMMTYNLYYDYLKEKSKNKDLVYIPNLNYILEETEIETDEIEHQKLILDILSNLSNILTKSQFDIFIKKTINNKSCKAISQELNTPYRWTTDEYREAKRIVLEHYGDWYKKINKNV